jgi:Ca-activated chloride channel family protein
MEWQQPEWLYLILPLGIAWLTLSVYSRGRRRRAAEAFVAQTMWDRILPVDSRARFWVKLLFREVGLVAGVVALAGPRFGTQYEDVIPRGSDLYVLIDVSRSMLAEDVPPSRLGRAKADVAALVNRLEGERIGLIAFAGQAVVKCPLTVDYDAFRRSLDELDPDSAPRGGTAIGDAIRKAIEVFRPGANRDQAILLITDGDDQQSYPLEAAAVAAERHVTVFAIGLGDADQGARIPKGQESRSYLEYQGSQVWSKLNGSLLKEIALKTSGVYVPAGTRSYDLGELYAKYLQGRRAGEEQTYKRIRRAEQFQIFLALAVLALLADAFIRLYPPAPKASEQTVTSRPATRTKLSTAVPAASAVDLIGEDEVGENRPLPRAERPFARVIDQRPDQVGREQVGGELNPIELAVDRGCKGLDRGGLRQARHSLEQHMPVGQQSDQQPREHMVLADQDLADLCFHSFDLVRILKNLILDPLDVDCHFLRETPAVSIVCLMARPFSCARRRRVRSRADCSPGAAVRSRSL